MQGDASFSFEIANSNTKLDDDGRPKRTGTIMTASAHIITAVIGSGVLSLAWAIAQLGWIAGPIVMIIFSAITWYTASLLADCYRDPITGTRNYTYMDVVKSNLGGTKNQLCGVALYANLIGVTIGYSITTAISMAAIKRSNCFHKQGHQVGCHISNNKFMVLFGGTQIILSQIPSFHELSILSIIAAIMSFSYSSIGLALSIAKIAGGGHVKTSLTGIPVNGEGGVSSSEKIWSSFQSLGDIAFAFAYSAVLIDIQDTLKASPPENVVMKKATLIGVSISTMFYMLCGIAGYAAFGNQAPGNFLTGFGFYEPFWLIDFANMCIVVHLVGAYQVFCQPIFSFFEAWCHQKWPQSDFITSDYPIPTPFGKEYSFNFFRFIWRTTYVIFTTVIAMLLPFFNDFVGLLGAASFWPLTVYFPVEMYISRAKIRRFSLTWIWMQVLSVACLVVSLLAAAGSVQGLIKAVQAYKPFQSKS